MAVRALVSLLALVPTACERNEAPSAPPEPERQVTSPAAIARKLGVEAGTFEVPVDPAPPAGDLKTDMERFTTLEACVAEHTASDPLVGDALESIGYETFLRDACRVLEAAKTSSAEPCAVIDSSALRARCSETVAMLAATPEACPMALEARPMLGRGATCVAVASRDPRLCAAEERSARATCEALASGDVERCGDKGHDSSKGRCRRAASRYKLALNAAAASAPDRAAKAFPKAHGTLKVTPKPGAPPLELREIDLKSMLDRGVVVVVSNDGARAEIGEAQELSLTQYVPSPMAGLRVSATVTMGLAKGVAPTVEHFELSVPGGATLVCPGARCKLAATSASMDRARGGALAVTIDGEVALGARAYDVHVEATTFVRDVVDRTSAAAAKAPR